jgi:hypothetical protein
VRTTAASTQTPEMQPQSLGVSHQAAIENKIQAWLSDVVPAPRVPTNCNQTTSTAQVLSEVSSVYSDLASSEKVGHGWGVMPQLTPRGKDGVDNGRCASSPVFSSPAVSQGHQVQYVYVIYNMNYTCNMRHEILKSQRSIQSTICFADSTDSGRISGRHINTVHHRLRHTRPRMSRRRSLIITITLPTLLAPLSSVTHASAATLRL